MQKTLLKYKKRILVFSLLYIPLIFISVFKVDYNLTAPGYNDNVNQFIEIENGYEEKGSFHTTSIISQKGITYLQYYLGTWEDKVFITPFPEYYDNIVVSDLKVMSYLMKDDSLYTSLIVGILNTGYELEYESFLTVYLTWNYLEEDTLKIGDKILDITIDGVSVDIRDIACGDTAVFTVLREEETLEFELSKKTVNDTTCGIGISTDIFSKIISTTVEYNLIETAIGGPSGGLMQSLFIYNQLTSFDHTLGLKIGGTGTIKVDGTVGAIGGIDQKIYTSAMNNVDIFFAPLAGNNYDNALKAFEHTNSDMIIVGVDTFDDAVNYLQNYAQAQGGESDE